MLSTFLPDFVILKFFLTDRKNLPSSIVKAICFVRMVKTCFLQLEVGDRVVLRGRDLQVIEKGQVLILPRVANTKAEVTSGRGQRPNVDAKGEENVLEGQPGGAVGETGRGVVVEEGQAHLVAGGVATVSVAGSHAGVVSAFDHQVVSLKKNSLK